MAFRFFIAISVLRSGFRLFGLNRFNSLPAPVPATGLHQDKAKSTGEKDHIFSSRESGGMGT
jgi:hypothetical protein